ncbi:MAG TPA: hypothetical protein VGV87_03385 [Blastocatellia bacterium]|jgi:hypothetical protein|nr:hypothetical protein [Blastocatellia bacterium]
MTLLYRTVAALLLIPFPWSMTVRGQNSLGIRSVDFRNFDYGSQPGEGRVLLRKGRSNEKTFGIPNSKLTAVKYADLDGDGREEAVVVIKTNLFGSGGYDEHYYVFTYRNGVPRRLFDEYKEQGRGIRIKDGALMIVAPYWDTEVPHCCPKYIETKAYRLKGSRLVVVKRWLRRNPAFNDFYSKRAL